jgi:hypothetical protein
MYMAEQPPKAVDIFGALMPAYTSATKALAHDLHRIIARGEIIATQYNSRGNLFQMSHFNHVRF